MTSQEKLKNICFENFTASSFKDNPILKNRLNDELAEIFSRDEENYFLEIVDKKQIYENEHNLLVPYLLGICKEYNQEIPHAVDYGDNPDIDVDYPPKLRDYLKEEAAPKFYGEDKVCNIATYGRFKIKQSILDMAKVLGLPRQEVLNITTKLPAKDDEGELLTWESAMDMFPDFRKYMNAHPDLAVAAQKLNNRIKSHGNHASGKIISNITLNNFVPLIRKNNKISSAWGEGQSGTNLGPVGLIKFDYLGLENLDSIELACDYITDVYNIYKKNNIKPISKFFESCTYAKDNKIKISNNSSDKNFSDKQYLNDPECMNQAALGNLKMVFQFDGSPGIRRLAKLARVTKFSHLVALTALYRPGPMESGMDMLYCKRKNNLENWRETTNPVVAEILKETFGLIIYQEDCTKLLNIIGKIPLKLCEHVRKAISKKKKDKFIKYREMFVENGKEILGSKENAEKFFDYIEAFSKYGFNLSHAVCYTHISAKTLYLKTKVPEAFIPKFLDSFSPTGKRDYIRMKDYLIDASRNKIKCERVKINKSKSCFYFDGKVMHYPFNKIIGIKEDSAKKIESLQPFANYPDFLERFGPHKQINEALILLECFDEDKIESLKYFAAYKKYKEEQRKIQKTISKTTEKLNLKIKEITGVDHNVKINTQDLDQIINLYKNKKLTNSIVKILTKYKEDKLKLLNLEKPIYGKCEENIDEELLELLDINLADLKYLRFRWKHQVEEYCENPRTFEDLFFSIKESGIVDAMVVSIEEKISKKDTKYYTLCIEDCTLSRKYITIWSNDYEQFKDLLHDNNIISIHLKKPKEGSPYQSYNLYPLDYKFRYNMPPRDKDLRIIGLKN